MILWGHLKAHSDSSTETSLCENSYQDYLTISKEVLAWERPARGWLFSVAAQGKDLTRTHAVCRAEQRDKACGCWETHAICPPISQRTCKSTGPLTPIVKCSCVLVCYKLSNKEYLWDMCNVPYALKYFTLMLFWFSSFKSNKYFCQEGESVPHGVST